MSEGGALAGLQAAIEDWCDATAAAPIAAELAAVEARLARFLRFVRADDALHALDAWGASNDELLAAAGEWYAARAALTDEDLA